MAMSADLRDRLTAAGLAAYRDEAPQGSPRPFVIILVVSDPRPSTYDSRTQLRETRTQLDCQALSRGDADALAEQVITIAEAAGDVGTTRFARSFVDSSRAYSERQDTGATIFVTSLDLMIWHAPAE